MRFLSILVAAVTLATSVAAFNVPPRPGDQLQRRQLCNGTVALDTRTQQYTVQEGDELRQIARRFNRGVCDIARANNLTNPNLIFTGATLVIPPQVCFPDSTSCLPAPTTATATCILGGPGFYVVRKGDTLTAIAAAFNITLAALEAANRANVPDPDVIEVAQVINVPVCPSSTCTISPYAIKPADIFVDLADEYMTTYGQIMALNPQADPNQLEPGQVITLPSYCHSFPGCE